MEKVRELMARAAECGTSGNVQGCKAALEDAAPLLAPVPTDPLDPQRATDQCQAARAALLVGDETLAKRFATLLLEQVAGILKTLLEPDGDSQLRINKLILANLYTRAFVPFAASNAWLDRQPLTGLGAFLAGVVNQVRPELDGAGWSGWPYPEPLASDVRELAARAVVDLGRWLLDGPSGVERAPDAEALGNLALAVLQGGGQRQSAALVASDAHCLIGRALTTFGDFVSTGDRAVAAFEASLAIQEQFGKPDDLATDRSNLGALCVRLAEIDQAFAEGEEARGRRAAAEGKGAISAAALEAARVARCRADARLNRAQSLLDQSLVFYRAHPGRKTIDALINRAAASMKLEKADYAAARADLAEARAIAQDPTLILLQLGQVEIDAGDFAAAERALQDAMSERDRLSRHDRTLLLGSYGKVLYRLKRCSEAFGFLKDALAEVEAAHGASRSSRAYVSALKQFRWIAEAQMACCAELGGTGNAAYAFDIAERMRWPTFLTATRYIALDWRGPPDPRVQEEHELLRVTSSIDLGPPDVLAPPAVDAAFARLEQIWDGLAPLDPDYVAIRRRVPVPANRVADLLDDEVSALIAYCFGEEIEDLAIAWVFRRGAPGPQLISLPCRSGAIVEDVRLLRAATDESPVQTFNAAAARLHSALIAPLGDAILASGGICFVPFGPTHNVPFAALYDGANYLAENRAIVVAPSVAALRWSRRKAEDHAAHRSLIVTATEGATLKEGVVDDLALFEQLARKRLVPLLPTPCFIPKEQATKDRLLACLAPEVEDRPWDIVHIACHGLFETVLPDGTLAPEGVGARLVLTGPKDAVGRDLTALEIATRFRPRGALVVLSACESAVAVAMTNDELFGLGHAFVFAGAGAVLASLWYVVQENGVELTRRFYGHLLDQKNRMSRVEALHQARIETMRRKALLGLIERAVHPYLWSAFQLVGDWR